MEELDIAKEIIAKSGNNFHSKVVERFREMLDRENTLTVIVKSSKEYL